LQLAIPHIPAVQAGVPFAVEQISPQTPQLLTLVLVLVSQPLAGFESQSAKPGAQAVMWQVPPVHASVALLVLQAFPQEPQLLELLPVLTSQPFAGLPSQSA
jgi:hypothetical protein